MGTLAKVLIIFVGLATIGAIVQERSRPQRSETELAQERALQQAQHKRKAAAYAAAKVLRDLMRDPDSFVVESAHVNDDGSLICVEYRSRNGFGGMNREFAAFRNGKPFLKDVSVWNKHCTQRLFDETAAAKSAT